MSVQVLFQCSVISEVPELFAVFLSGGLVLLALAVLTPWFYYIPQSALAGVIIVAVLQMVDLKIVRTLWRVQSKYCKSCNVNEELIFPNLPNGFKALILKLLS